MIQPDIDSIRLYVAYTSVGASTVRGLRTTGVVSAARSALSGVNLASFDTDSESQFRKAINRETKRVQRILPDGASYWGVARKVLNIFLRGSLYNIYLNQHHGLSRSDSFLRFLWTESPPPEYELTPQSRSRLGKA